MASARNLLDMSYAKTPADQKFTFQNKQEINDYLNWYNKGNLGNTLKAADQLLSKHGAATTPGIFKDMANAIRDGIKDVPKGGIIPPAGSGSSGASNISTVVTNPAKAADLPASGVEDLSTQFQSLVDQIYDLNEKNNARMEEAAERQMRYQDQSQAKTMQFNAEQAQLDRDWQEYMSNTAHQREIADLKAAGLNPVLSANGGAAVGSGASASVAAQSGSKADVDTSITNFLGNVISALASVQNAETNAKAALGSANIHAAAMMGAARYGLYGNLGGSLLGLLSGIFR